MTEEYLDVVDEKGNLTGQKELRSVVHEKGLWHQTVHIVCYRFVNDQLEIIVHLRSKTKDRNPNKWAASFGGHVESGFSVAKTAVKELFEEAGIATDAQHLIVGMKNFSNNDTNREVVQVYYLNYELSAETLRFDDGEVQAARWMNVEAIKKEIISNPDMWAVRIETMEKIEEDLLHSIKK